MSDLHRVEWFVSIHFIPLPRRPHDLHPRFLQPQTSPRLDLNCGGTQWGDEWVLQLVWNLLWLLLIRVNRTSFVRPSGTVVYPRGHSDWTIPSPLGDQLESGVKEGER